MATRVDDTPPKQRRSRGGADAEEATPELGGVAGPPAPKVTPEPPYLFVYHPERWGVIEGLVVPILSKLVAKKGVNGVDWDERSKKVLMETAVAQAQAKGGTVIPWAVDGRGRSYIKRVKGGGWVSRWETLYPGSSQRTVDSVGYATWLRSLIDRGVLPNPPLYVLAELAEQLQARIGELAKKGAMNGAYEVRVQRAQRDLEAVLAETERCEDLDEEEGEEEPDLDGVPRGTV
ncbi:MAG: hypothetical protein KC621_35175 [Myxococcales bacterium]|nr:hypothetical protein [Myxococcales bacterium]